MSVRDDVLAEAKKIVTTDRNTSYGEPERNFENIAQMWSGYVGIKLYPHDVAAMMIMLKVARISVSPDRMDHWVDIAGYAACGGEVRPES